MHKEYMIGCKLKHKGIVDYQYFIRCDSPKLGSKEQEMHILMEFCEGGNL